MAFFSPSNRPWGSGSSHLLLVPKLGQMHLETGGRRCRTSWLCSEMPEASRDSNGMSGPVTQGAHSTLQTHMGYSWPSSPLSLMQGRQGGYCSVPDNVRGPAGNRQVYDLEPEKACNSQPWVSSTETESKHYGGCQGQSMHWQP